MSLADIEANASRLLSGLPEGVTLVAAAKTRSSDEVQAAISAGVTCVGHNYVQEADPMIADLGAAVRWHLIGHLQRNKVKRAVELFDVIETVDSKRLAEAIDRRCRAVGRVMPVLIEVNSGREPSKAGVMPEDVEALCDQIVLLEHVRLSGLMTMGPAFGDPELARPYFRATRDVFERLVARRLPRANVRYLSMGMSNSYRVAIDEGANVVRIGTRLFGPRGEGTR